MKKLFFAIVFAAATAFCYEAQAQGTEMPPFNRLIVSYAGDDAQAKEIVSMMESYLPETSTKLGLISGKSKLDVDYSGFMTLTYGAENEKKMSGQVVSFDETSLTMTVDASANGKSMDINFRIAMREDGKGANMLIKGEHFLAILKLFYADYAKSSDFPQAEGIFSLYPEIEVGLEFAPAQ